MRRYGCWQARAASIFRQRLVASGRYYYSVPARMSARGETCVSRANAPLLLASIMEARDVRRVLLCAVEGRIRTNYDVLRTFLSS